MAQAKRNPRYIAILALAAGLILVLGVALKPSAPGEEDAGTPLEQFAAGADATRLQLLGMRRSLEGSAEYFASLSASLEGQVVRLQAAGQSGVLWDRGAIATAAGFSRLPANDVAERPGLPRWRVWPEVTAPHLAAALLASSEEDPPRAAPRYPAGFFTSGSWAMAVWRHADGGLAYAPGQYLGPSEASCEGGAATVLETNIPLDSTMLGGGVFDLDGALMGVIVRCEQSLAVLDVETLERAYAPPSSVHERLLSRFGMSVHVLDQAELERFDVEYGVVVGEVWIGWEANAAGLRPGDVIIAMEEQPVTALADLEPLTLPVARETVDLTTIRAGKKVNRKLRARGDRGGDHNRAGLAWARSHEGFLVREVQPESRAAAAGLQPGDRLVSVDQSSPSSPRDMDRLLAGKEDEPVFAIVLRGDRFWGVFL